MTEPHPQWFHFGPWIFAVDTALALITAARRDTRPLDVAAWAQACGLSHLDNTNARTISLVGATRDGLDRSYATATDLTTPVIIAQLLISGSPSPLLIDGIHRLYRAWRGGLPQLPAYLLTVEETRQVQRDVRLGPGRTRLSPPS
ncbi:hypothetical protein ACFOOK_02860 [Micromonospora krabiensis]|uniref:ParB-like nuclease domain-containing protein n=1 Tax=Micromonospora krabiensis TaxID=307121 RepID=A0A1C3MWJ9_9ACTN|nr:hypothetical protein [Micromonospora krabiensis]SBV24703.1 hypothetical protein GA0070620_0137 [Micromonospora krabiensis]